LDAKKSGIKIKPNFKGRKLSSGDMSRSPVFFVDRLPHPHFLFKNGGLRKIEKYRKID